MPEWQIKFPYNEGNLREFKTPATPRVFSETEE